MSLLEFTTLVLLFLVLPYYFLGAPQDPQPIPDGYDFPATESELLRLCDADGSDGMRRRVAGVAGMLQPTVTGEAVLEAWFSARETFGTAQSQPLAARKIQRWLQVPRQFRKRGLDSQTTLSRRKPIDKREVRNFPNRAVAINTVW